MQSTRQKARVSQCPAIIISFPQALDAALFAAVEMTLDWSLVAAVGPAFRAAQFSAHNAFLRDDHPAVESIFDQPNVQPSMILSS